MLPFAFAGSTELHRISLLLFQLVIIRLVAEGDAFLPQLRQPLAVDLDADDIAYEGLRYWSRWFDEDSTRIDEAYAKLAYFDSKNFAPMVKCPVLFGTGTADIVCPPATQFAVYNNLTCEKRHEFFEGFGHEEIQDFDDLIIPFFCKGGEAHV